MEWDKTGQDLPISVLSYIYRWDKKKKKKRSHSHPFFFFLDKNLFQSYPKQNGILQDLFSTGKIDIPTYMEGGERRELIEAQNDFYEFS